MGRFRIRYDNGADMIWLEDTKDGTRYHYNKMSNVWQQYLISQRNKLNTEDMLSKAGI